MLLSMKNSNAAFFLVLMLSISANFLWAQPESANVLTFNEEQVLFIGDSYSGQIFAYPMSEQAQTKSVSFNVRALDRKIASALGAQMGDFKIVDLAVNPVSKNAFLAVHKIVGKQYKPLVLRVTPDGIVSNFDLDKRKFSRFKVKDSYQSDLVFWSRIPVQSLTFTDLDFYKGKLYIAGLSNTSFDASLRVVDYPFKPGKQSTTTVEIYHTVHNQQETRSPIQTLDVIELEGKEYILALYTCTPMVLFPLDQIQDGKHLVGKVIAELGYGNAPIEIKSFTAQDPQGNTQNVALVINKTRGAMLFNMEDIAASNKLAGLSTPQGFNSTGTPYFTPSIGGTYQLEDLDASHLLTLRRNPETGQTEMLSFMKGFYFRLTDFVSDYIYPDYEYGEAGELWRPAQNMLKVDEGHPETVVDKKK